MTNGYFGGYIGKRQPTGSLEFKKCIDKLCTLRSKMAGQGKAAQLRAASQRLMTEIEMNSTYRGAVEVFNLCRNLHPHDVLFAECIRTFSSANIDGRSWMYRLTASQLSADISTCTAQSYVPPTKKPNVRTDRSKANEMDVYGYRPLVHPWRLLSPYEFLMTWRAEPLLVPTYYDNKGENRRTQWTAKGLELCSSKEYKAGDVVARPGVHYTVLNARGDDVYSTFPEEPEKLFNVFRHAWVLVRRRRPYVIVINGERKPSSSRTATENAKYCSLFFRPWTALRGDAQVPHISLLGCPHDVLQKVYEGEDNPSTLKFRKTTPAVEKNLDLLRLAESMNWHKAWDEYVRGRVVSDTAARLIQCFLLKTIAASGATEREDDKSDADESAEEHDLPRLKLSASALRGILAPPNLVVEEDCDVDEKGTHKKTQKFLQSSKKTSLRHEYNKSMEIGSAVWSTPPTEKAAVEKRCPGHMYEDEVKEHIAARRIRKEKKGDVNAPFNEERNAAAFKYTKAADGTIDDVFKEILEDKEKPNAEQKAFLQHFVRRLKIEVVEARQQTQGKGSEEPLLDMIHGFPGTGKSLVISWMRKLMEDGLKWEHGVQFACLAFQNAMAAQINGNTLHHWSGIPCRAVDGNTTGDRHKQSIKCQALRVLIIDELSMISAELLGSLEYVIRVVEGIFCCACEKKSCFLKVHVISKYVFLLQEIDFNSFFFFKNCFSLIIVLSVPKNYHKKRM